MTAPPKAAKVPYAERISDVKIGRFLDNAQKRKLRQVSKGFNQAFFDNLKCADAQELQEMRKESEPCKNTAKVLYNPEKGIRRAIMCAIMSVDQKLHVYVERGNLEPFLASSIKCFDQHYALELTLLVPNADQDPYSDIVRRSGLRCRGGFSEGLMSDDDVLDLLNEVQPGMLNPATRRCPGCRVGRVRASGAKLRQ